MPQAATEMFQNHPLASSHNIDHARQVLSDVYLPLDFPSVSKTAELNLRLNVVKVGRVTAGYLRFGDAIRIRTAEASDYHVDIPLTGRATMRSGRHQPFTASPKTAGLFMPGYTADLDCDEDFSQMAVMIPHAEMQLELESLLGHDAPRALEFSSELHLESASGRTVLQTLHLIDHVSKESPSLLEHPLASQHLEQVLIESLLLSQPHNYSDALKRPVVSAGVRPVAKAVELLRAHPERPWTVSELATDVAVSVRSLQEGFRRTTNNSPMAYLRELRLEQIHEELAGAEPGSVTVTEVAAKWGITHFGRFAASYRLQFSEKPSETMRRSSHSKD